MTEAKIKKIGNLENHWQIPDEDVLRQATAALRGYIYQLHQSASEWINLGDDDLLFLEAAEDITRILNSECKEKQTLEAIQVKDTRASGNITLNTPEIIDAINALFRYQNANPTKKVRLIYLTTSLIGIERKDPLPSKIAGLAAWKTAVSGGDIEEIRNALLLRIKDNDLNLFIKNSPSELFRNKFLSSFIVISGAQDLSSIEENNRIALMNMHEEVESTEDMAYKAYDAVFKIIVHAILYSTTRQLSRKDLINCLKKATSISIPSQYVIDHFSTFDKKKINNNKNLDNINNDIDLKYLAKTLIQLGEPPSLISLFPEAAQASKSALTLLSSFDRILAAVGDSEKIENIYVPTLPFRPELKHIIIGQPGAGKSHTLWQLAKQLLATGDFIPLLLSAAQHNTWDDVVKIIKNIEPAIPIDTLFNNHKVCVLIDGWSEFAIGEHITERKIALSQLHKTRVIASARYSDSNNIGLKVWTLELLPPHQVIETLLCSRPLEPTPSQAIIDLLRLPLLLSIHTLSKIHVSAIGELLRQFHEHVARNLPEDFSEILIGAVAESELINNRSFGRFSQNIRIRANAKGVKDSIKLLLQLGTLTERNGQVKPIHDLYWSWLAGQGFLLNRLTEQTINILRTRESYKLAFQSGMHAHDIDLLPIINNDLVLASMLSSPAPTNNLVSTIRLLLNDSRLAVRNRGALAAIEINQSKFIPDILNVFSSLVESKIYPFELKHALHPENLFTHRSAIMKWLGAPGSNQILDLISESGGIEWNHWLHQAAIAGKISYVDALAASLACSSNVPIWGETYLDDLLTTKYWKLDLVSKRQSNISLARKLARDYDRLVANVIPRNSSGWCDLNQLLISCGDEEVFHLLLKNFAAMSEFSQERLSFAIIKKGSSWIAKFQRIAFASPVKDGHPYSKLFDHFSMEIDDVTARQWIENGYKEIGWKVLIARYGELILPELILKLPQSFAGFHYIPELACMKFFQKSPIYLIKELWGRLGSPMQPLTMEHMLDALATVEPEGMYSIISFIFNNPDSLPIYHICKVIRLYESWTQKTGLEINIGSVHKESFTNWIIKLRAIDWEDSMTPSMLALAPDLAIEFTLNELKNDEDKAFAVLKTINDLKSFNEPLFEFMISSSRLATHIPYIFANCFDTFPDNALQQCLNSSYIDQKILLFKLSSTNNPLHHYQHIELIKRTLEEPTNLHSYQYIANMLTAYSRSEIIDILKSVIQKNDNNSLWLIREIEMIRAERLIDEFGKILD
ncbi:hypothetical protein ACG9XW_04685 [Acinetobacter guillouiae]|uniref:hypothetical protein n=1 Tax=Acinetobacter guillouiae TaxID=106649 RepID=UPI003AF8CD8F